MKFDDSTWSCCDALMYMFFTDCAKIRSKGEEYSRLLSYLQSEIDNNQDQQQASVPEEQTERVRRLALLLRKHPAKLTSGSELSPIAWMKIGVSISSKGIPLSRFFLNGFFRWRTRNHQATKLALIIQSKRRPRNISLRTTNKSAAQHPDNAYAIDVFLLAYIPNFNHFPHIWGIEYKSIDLHDRAAGATKRKAPVASQKSKEDQVGADVYKSVKQCIEIAASERLIPPQLRERMPDGRYLFLGTRQELLDKLRMRFPGALRGSDRNVKQAISFFAECRKNKRVQ